MTDGKLSNERHVPYAVGFFIEREREQTPISRCWRGRKAANRVKAESERQTEGKK